MRFPWNRKDTELEREIAHHLHQLREEYQRQGHSPDEALRLARRTFGGRDQVKEQCRDERRWAWITGLRQDIAFGLRIMRKTPVVTAAAVLSLALGIGANTAILSLMDIVLWKDLPVPDAEQLTEINWQGRGFPRELADGASGSMRREGGHIADFFSHPTFQAFRDRTAGQASIAAFADASLVSVSYAGRPTIAEQRPVSGNFLSTLQVQPQIGRLLTGADDRDAAPATVVLSHRFWVRVLGSDPKVVGETIRIDTHPHVIVGILHPEFSGLVPGDSTEIYTPLHHAASVRRFRGAKDPLDDNRYWGVQMLARRAPGVSEKQLSTVLDTVFPSTWSAQPKDPSMAPHIRLYPASRGLGSLRREFRNPLYVLGGLVGLLLVIACTNIANLLLARAVARQKEVAMRISLGCSRFRLMRQFLTESTMLAIAGGAASIVVAYLTANLLGQFLGGRSNVPVAVTLDIRILALAGSTTVLALILFGLFPAWKGARLPDMSGLKQGSASTGHTARHRWTAGRTLIMAQMAMSVFLVLTAVLFTRNLLSIQTADPGFDRRNMVLFGLRPGTSGYDKARLPQFYFNVEQQLASTPGVTGVGLASFRPMNIGGWWDSVRLAGQTEINQVSVNGVTPSYLPLYSPRLVAGRNFQWTDITSDAKVALISEDLARKMGGPSVLGQPLLFTDGRPGAKPREFQIIGIVPAIAATSMKERPYVVWLPFEKDRDQATVVIRTSQPAQAVLPAIRQTMSQVDKNLPMVDVITMEEQISKILQRERMFATLCSGFGMLALLLSVVGLYGVMAYSTSRRRREIGVRLALGAIPRNVLSMILREGLALAVLGILVGLPVVWLGSKYLEKELFQMKPLDPTSLVLALGILLAAAVVAVGIPALRASGLEPAQTLRQE